VYFASGSWTLTDNQRTFLKRVAHRIDDNGFTDVHLAGYTDSLGSVAYNMRLSHQRTSTVAALLRQTTGLTSDQAWYGEKDPAASGASAAANRRVEIYIS
jgi:OOP family OmpA-OmpF porin